MMKLELLAGCLGVFCALSVSAGVMFPCSPYIGFDVQQRYMDFTQGYGQRQFTKTLLQGNVYFGARFNPNVGFELGYESSQKKSNSSSTISDGDVALGQLYSYFGFTVPKTFVQTNGAHLSLTSFIPVYEDKTELLASAGMMLMRIKLKYLQIAETANGTFNAALRDGTTSNFSATRLIPRFMVGIQHRLGDSFSVRATLVYERTNRQLLAKNIPSGAILQPGAGARLAATPKNSTILGLGVFYNF